MGGTTFGVVKEGRWASSGESSHSSEKSERPASMTDRSRDLGTNIRMRVRRLSR